MRRAPRSKYGAVRTTVDGHTFASKAEARRYQQLKLMVRAEMIHHLTLQPRFPLTAHGAKICVYVADFAYWLNSGGPRVVEDVKGVLTPVYRLKKKMVHAQYGVTITEVKA